MVIDMQTSLPAVEEIWDWLDWVSDPEIPVVSVVDLGIVRDVRWIEDADEPVLEITITPTYSGCPATAVIQEDIVKALRQQGITDVRIKTRLSPAWTTNWITEKGRQRLLEYGIAPPLPAAEKTCDLGFSDAEAPISCPRCRSTRTRMVSRFGSTPCKAFYVCESCHEPFDYFKCH